MLYRQVFYTKRQGDRSRTQTLSCAPGGCSESSNERARQMNRVERVGSYRDTGCAHKGRHTPGCGSHNEILFVWQRCQNRNGVVVIGDDQSRCIPLSAQDLPPDPDFASGAYRYKAEFKVGSETCTEWDFILRKDGGSWKVTDIMRGRCN